MKIAYIFVIADLFHYGHLQLIQAAKNMCDRLICGVLTDEAVIQFKGNPFSNVIEREAVIKAVR